MVIFYYFDFSPPFEFIISIAFLYHFYCIGKSSHWFPASLPLIPRLFCIPTQIPDPDFKKILTLVKKHTVFYYYCINHGIKSLFTCSETLSVISPKIIDLKLPQIYNCEVWAKNYKWMSCYLRFISKGRTAWPKLSIFCNFCLFTKI